MSEQEVKEGLRLGVYLAACGACSRREAAKLVDEARVKVNGVVVRDLSFRVVEGVHDVMLNNRPLRRLPVQTLLYHKPKGVVMSHEAQGNLRSWTTDLPQYKHLKSAGRLDAMSEGLVVLTNDGQLHHSLTHPGAKVAKNYKVWLRGRLDERALATLEGGRLELDGERVLPCRVKMLFSSRDGREHVVAWTLHEGRNRQIRRMAEMTGLTVTRLVRESVGPLHLTAIPPGGVKPLSQTEIKKLQQAVAEAAQSAPPRPPRRPPAGAGGKPPRREWEKTKQGERSGDTRSFSRPKPGFSRDRDDFKRRDDWDRGYPKNDRRGPADQDRPPRRDDNRPPRQADSRSPRDFSQAKPGFSRDRDDFKKRDDRDRGTPKNERRGPRDKDGPPRRNEGGDTRSFSRPKPGFSRDRDDFKKRDDRDRGFSKSGGSRKDFQHDQRGTAGSAGSYRGSKPARPQGGGGKPPGRKPGSPGQGPRPPRPGGPPKSRRP